MRAALGFPLLAGLVGSLAAGLTDAARAQETVFNVPSPDVLERGKLYLETDQYARPWQSAAGHAAVFLVRVVAGLGHGGEVGVNSGAFDYLHASAPFVDGTVKWRPIRSGTLGVILGDDAGVGLGGGVGGEVRDLAYAAGFVTLTGPLTRASVGSYCATRGVFEASARCGAQATLEQPIPGVAGWELAGDWFSGPGAFATAGVIGTVHRIIIYAGYGLANGGRQDDLLTVELGVTLF